MYDKTLLDIQHLKQLAQIQDELSTIKSIKKVTSLYTVPNFRRFLDEKTWHSMLENKTYVQDDLSLLKTDLADNRLYVGKFVSKTADTVVFYLNIPKDKFGDINLKNCEAIQQVLDRHKPYFEKIFQIGPTETSYFVMKKAKHDFFICIPSIFILMAILFGWLFRNIILFALPLFSSVFGIFCALGTMGWIGLPVSPLFIAAIVLTLAIGVAEGAHIIHAYQKSMRLHPSASLQTHQEFILKMVLLPFLLAVITALLGFMLDVLSFVSVIMDAAYALALCFLFNTAASIFI